MRILSLDLSTITGWACSDGTSGVCEFPNLPHPGDRPMEVYAWVENMIHRHTPRAIVYELAHHRGGAATRCALGMITAVEMAASQTGIVVKGYHSATIKKHATGSGRAQKCDMLAAARKRNPDRDFIDDNEVDALFLLDLALHDGELEAGERED